MPGRTIAERERDYKAVAMSQRGFSYRQIAAELGWKSPSTVHDAIRRGLRDMNAVDGPELVRLMRERLDDYRRQAWRVLGRPHYVTTQSGAVARHPDTGQPLVDDGPVLQALDRLLRYDVEERKMLGVDAPTRSRIEVVDDDLGRQLVDQMEQELARLAADQGHGVT